MKPKKVNRVPKRKYPKKRNNYRNYSFADWIWLDVFNDIENLKSQGQYPFMKPISIKYNIPYATLVEKYNRWVTNGKPDDVVYIDGRGTNNGCFNETEEYDLYIYIKNVYIDTNKHLDDASLRVIAKMKWDSLHPNRKNEFMASKGWVYEFKLKWGLSSLSARLSKTTIPNNTKVNDFVIQCDELDDIDLSLLYNMDETFWHTVNGNLKVIGLTGSEHRKLDTNVDSKLGFTAIFIISASGLFLNPIIVMKGKTERCLNKISVIDDDLVHKKYSLSGWVTIDIIKFVLNLIYNNVKDKISAANKAVLILDEYSVHTNDEIKQEASKLNIKLVYVPPGTTPINQPLDVSINGAVKSIAKGLERELYVLDPFLEPTLTTSINSLIIATSRIKEETIIKSFIKANILSRSFQ